MSDIKAVDFIYDTVDTSDDVPAVKFYATLDHAILHAFLYTYAWPGGFTDYTTQANQDTPDDVPLTPSPTATDDAFYFGDVNKFSYIRINISTAGVGGTITWEYYNGSTWATLTVVDGTNSFTTSGTHDVTFTQPTDWTKTIVNGQNDYWVRARVLSPPMYTTRPRATQIWLPPISLQMPEDASLEINEKLNDISTFDIELYNNSTNRAALSNINRDLKIYRARLNTPPIFIGRIEGDDAVEYADRHRINISGYHKTIELSHAFFERLTDSGSINPGNILIYDRGADMYLDVTSQLTADPSPDINLNIFDPEDALYIGYEKKPSCIKVRYDTEGIYNATILWQYYGKVNKYAFIDDSDGIDETDMWIEFDNASDYNTFSTSSGTVTKINVVDGGAEYTSAPIVAIVGGGGEGAALTAVLGTGTNVDKVTSITINNKGVGYRLAPTITIAAPTGTPAVQATATARVSGGNIIAVNILNQGSGYLAPPVITVDSIVHTTATATAVLGTGTSADKVKEITITNAGVGYTTVPTITFDNTGTGGEGAFADATVGNEYIRIDDEIMLVLAVNNVAGVMIAFRGQQTTVPKKHANNARIWNISHNDYTWKSFADPIDHIDPNRPIIDETRGFKKQGPSGKNIRYIIIPDKPSDWKPTLLNGKDIYHMRWKVHTITGTPTRAPALDRVWVGTRDVGRVQYDNVRANEILQDVLDHAYLVYGTQYVIAECPTKSISLRGEYESHLKWISEIANAVTWNDVGDTKGYEWWIDNNRGVHIRDMRTNGSYVSITKAIQQAYAGDGEDIYTDYTTQANDITTNDVQLTPPVGLIYMNSAFYFGMDNTFSIIRLNIGIAGIGGGITWEYYNGTEWKTLTCSDNTSGFTKSGYRLVTFMPPTTWAKITIPPTYGNNMYWVRARVTDTSFTAQPKASRIWLDDSYNRGNPYVITSTLSSLERRQSYKMANRVFSIGYGDGVNQLTVIRQNTSSQDTYGLRDTLYTDSKVVNWRLLAAKADTTLARLKSPELTYECEIRYEDFLDTGLKVGDWVKINQPEWNTNNQVVRLRAYKLDTDNVTLEVSTEFEYISSLLTSLDRNIDLVNKTMAGATTIYQVGPFIDNLDTAHPAYLYVYIPNQAKVINDVKLSYRLLDFRTDGATGSTQSSVLLHSHKFGIVAGMPTTGSDVHLIGSATDGTTGDSSVHASADDDATTDVAGSGSYAVIETEILQPLITVNINTVDIFTNLIGGQVDLDITQWMYKGWNTIVFKPKSSPPAPYSKGLGRIQADVIVECFIQTR